jgi:hypothetical protein
MSKESFKSHKIVFEYEFDFILLGLVSPEKEYKLAWYINKELGIELEKDKDLCYDFVKDYKFLISNFIFKTEYSSFRLLKNRSVEYTPMKKPFLLPELYQYDYFIMLDGEFAEHYQNNQQKLKKVPIIHLVKEIEVETLQSKDNLLIN